MTKEDPDPRLKLGDSLGPLLGLSHQNVSYSCAQGNLNLPFSHQLHEGEKNTPHIFIGISETRICVVSLHSRHEHFCTWLLCGFHSLPQVSCGVVSFTVLADLPQALHHPLMTMVCTQKGEDAIKSFYTFLCYLPSHRICGPVSSGIVASLVFRIFHKGGTLPQQAPFSSVGPGRNSIQLPSQQCC